MEPDKKKELPTVASFKREIKARTGENLIILIMIIIRRMFIQDVHFNELKLLLLMCVLCPMPYFYFPKCLKLKMNRLKVRLQMYKRAGLPNYIQSFRSNLR